MKNQKSRIPSQVCKHKNTLRQTSGPECRETRTSPLVPHQTGIPHYNLSDSPYRLYSTNTNARKPWYNQYIITAANHSLSQTILT